MRKRRVPLSSAVPNIRAAIRHTPARSAPACMWLMPSRSSAGIAVASADLTMAPTMTVPLGDEASAKSVLRVVDALEEHDDVQNVWVNFEPDETSEPALR